MSRDWSKLQIVCYPDPVLRKVCRPVEAFDADLAALAGRMLELMRAEQGVGLAAPQVGLPLRLFVCNVTGDLKDDMILVNPEIRETFGDAESQEGCLSIPDVTVTVRRAQRCRIVASDLTGRPIEADGADLLARCWQHELDHLNGRLIIDVMSETDRIANRKTLRELERKHKSSRGVVAL